MKVSAWRLHGRGGFSEDAIDRMFIPRPLRFTILNSNPQGYGVRRWGLRRWLGHEPHELD